MPSSSIRFRSRWFSQLHRVTLPPSKTRFYGLLLYTMERIFAIEKCVLLYLLLMPGFSLSYLFPLALRLGRSSPGLRLKSHGLHQPTWRKHPTYSGLGMSDLGREEGPGGPGKQHLLNVICNDVVKTILRGQEEDVKQLRVRLVGQQEEIVSDEMSQLFFENLLLVCDHETHPEVDTLQGSYAKAWKTILHYIEDAGWQLTDPPFTVMG
ncbi:unnamed protein product [Discosporangium mesarthrocarpum]